MPEWKSARGKQFQVSSSNKKIVLMSIDIGEDAAN